MQAHHQEILQKTALQQSLTDTLTDRCTCDGPSYASVVPGTSFCYYQTRAHTTQPTTVRHNCDRPSLGNHRVINEAYPTQPVGVYYKISPFILPNHSFHRVPLLFLPFTSLLNFHHLPLSTNHCSPAILQSPTSYNLLVGVAAVGVFLVTEYLPILFFSNSKVCVSNFYSFILHFCLLISISLVLRHMFISCI